jgi:hypothetical protein
MKKHIILTIVASAIITSASVAQNKPIISPQAVGYRVINKTHTFIGYGSTPAQAIVNTGGLGMGKVTADYLPYQIAQNIWMSRRVVSIPTIDPVYSAKSVQNYIKATTGK